jgi:hypothetical protein
VILDYADRWVSHVDRVSQLCRHVGAEPGAGAGAPGTSEEFLKEKLAIVARLLPVRTIAPAFL